MYGLKQRDIEALKKHLVNIAGIEKAWLFGSRAMGNYKQGSDIDIAIAGQEINRSDILQAIDAINEEEPIPFFTEIIDFNTIDNPKLKEHILQQGQLLLDIKREKNEHTQLK